MSRQDATRCKQSINHLSSAIKERIEIYERAIIDEREKIKEKMLIQSNDGSTIRLSLNKKR